MCWQNHWCDLCWGRYELPPDTSEDDSALLHNVLTAMRGTERCEKYKVEVIQCGFLVRGTLPSEVFELDADDLSFISAVSPLRVEKVTVARAGNRNEVVVKVLNSKQRVMIDTSATFIACKKRKLVHIPAAP